MRALLIVSLVALPALALAIVVAPYMLVHSISRRWHGRRSASPRPAAVLAPAAHRPTLRSGYVS